MPFKHEQKEWAERKEADTYKQKLEYKEFLEVKAIVRKDGNIIPISFTWEDREIKIERVITSGQNHP